MDLYRNRRILMGSVMDGHYMVERRFNNLPLYRNWVTET